MDLRLAPISTAVCERGVSDVDPGGGAPPTRSLRGRRPRARVLFASLALGAMAGLVPAGAADAAAPMGLFHGSAYATSGNVVSGPLAIGFGPSAFVPCPCLGTDGEIRSNRLAAIAIGLDGNVLKASGALGTALTTATATEKTAEVTARIERINALSGLLTADSIVAVSNTTATATSITTNDDGSGFINLKIAGKPISPEVAPNTTIALPGIGQVVLKQEQRAGGGVRAALLNINMVAIYVTTANRFGLPIGARIVIAHAGSGFSVGSPSSVVSGTAWATSGNDFVGDGLVISVGRTAFLGMGCQGTNGETVSNAVTNAAAPPLVALGVGKTTAFGTGNVAVTTAKVERISLLNGLIVAVGVRAVARTAISSSGVRTRSTDGTSFSGLKVLGLPLPINVKPNTKIGLPGIGVVVLNEQIIPPPRSDKETQVNAIHVFVNTTNLLHLPVGAQLTVGHASAGADNVEPGV